jgi:quercetin dioxygenase-like cupin family protein
VSARSTPTLLGVLPVVLLAAAAAAAAQEPTNPAAAAVKTHIMVTPGDVRWGACPPMLPPGAQCAAVEGDPAAANVLFATRVRMPDGYRIPPHFHPADEHVVVLQGTFTVGTGDAFDPAKGTALGAGSFMVVPKGMHHYAWTTGETVLQVYAIGPWGLSYVNPADDPRARP